MRNFSTSVILLFLLSFVNVSYSEAGLHPFYVSIISVDHNPASGSLELTFKIFTDDLEQAIEAESDSKLRLATPEQSKNANKAISGYLKNHFKLKLDEKTVSGNYLGFEPEYDVTRVYVEYQNVSAFAEIEVTTDLLVDVLPDQSNIVHVSYQGETKSLMLNAGDRQGKLNFK
jgi:hypothetical protein